MAFRPYTPQELQQAAETYGLDPAFVQAVYAVESSNGSDPNAMRARTVKRKRDSTIVRGPFQLEDDTVSDLVRKQKLGTMNVDDPDTHLDLAMRLMSDLKDRYDGDYRKMAQAYLGGPGGVTNPKAKDELGTTTASYGNKILAEMNRIQGTTDVTRPADVPSGLLTTPNIYEGSAQRFDETSPFQHGADAGSDDLFGMSNPLMLASDRDDSLGGLVTGSIGLGIPEEMGGDLPEVQPATDADMHKYLAGLVDESFQDRVNA